MRGIRSFLIVSVIAVLLTAPAFAQGPPYPYSVVLSCTPPTGQTPAGYNFYRAGFSSGACGAAYTRLNSALVAGCSYTDNNPPNGLYCYQVTDVDTNNSESAPDQMQGHVAIPLPPPTGLNATVAKNANGTHDVIYAWTNPAGAVTGNTLYCGPTTYAPAVQVDFATTKVRVTTPPETTKCVVTATSATGESGVSNAVKVSVP